MDFKIKDDKIKKQRNTDKLDEKVQLSIDWDYIHYCNTKHNTLSNYPLYHQSLFILEKGARERSFAIQWVFGSCYAWR